MQYRKVFLFVVCLINWSCSYLAHDEVPDEFEWDRGQYVSCSTDKVAPVIDTVFTVTTTLNAICCTILSLPFAVLWGTSANYGFENAEKCAEYRSYRRKKANEEEDEEEYKRARKNEDVDQEQREKVEPKSKYSKKEIFEKAKKCQSKGGVWLDNSCQLLID